MCGIYGIVGDCGKQKLALARALCVLNADRGEHSAGIATSGADLESEIVKSAVHPYQFAKRKDFARLASADYRVLIGHTRFATHGSVTDQNAHPFKIGSTIGIHNGVVGNVAGMSSYTGKTFPVDSQYLIYCLDKFGTIGPAQGSLNLAYFGRKDCADLRIIRHGNPLAYAICNKGKAWIFSSDFEHLRQSLAIAGIRGQVWDFPDGYAMALTIGADKIVAESWEEIPALSDSEASPYKSKVKPMNWYDYGKSAKTITTDTCTHDAETESAWRDYELRDRIERDEWRDYRKDWKDVQRQEEQEIYDLLGKNELQNEKDSE